MRCGGVCVFKPVHRLFRTHTQRRSVQPPNPQNTLQRREEASFASGELEGLPLGHMEEACHGLPGLGNCFIGRYA